MVGEQPAELWSGARLVQRLSPSDEKQAVSHEIHEGAEKNKAALGSGCDPRRGPRREDHMITDTFDRRTIAKMEVALERACLLLPTGSEKHRARRIIAGKIIECANRGDATLSRLTEAGCAAAMQLNCFGQSVRKRPPTILRG